MSDTSLLRKGQYLVIDTDTTGRKIVAISGSTVTLAVATTTSGSGLAVSWKAPTFSTAGVLSA